MAADQRSAGISASDRQRVESLLLEFDRTWRPDAIAHFSRQVADYSPVVRRWAMMELVKIDLERAWASGREKSIEDYLQQFPELGAPETVSPDVIEAECEARARCARPVDTEKLRARFPRQYEAVQELLAKTRMPHSAASVDTSRPGVRDTAVEAYAGAGRLPEQFGRYQVLRRLGEGAMGAVFLAYDPQLDRNVAIKTPSFRGAQAPELLERFQREARSAATLRHANICPVFDVGEIDGTHFITMAFIEGRPLSDYIRTAGVPLRSAALVVRKLALALDHAHQNRVVHRDLKPANIMVDVKREPIVMDFGLARRDDSTDEARISRSGALLGTPAYMSPEQVEGDHARVGPASDIYSLGVILYELLTGRLPFDGALAAVLMKILSQSPPRPRELRPDVDPALESICLKMMAKQVGDRYGSMQQVADALSDWLRLTGQRAGTFSAPSDADRRTFGSSTPRSDEAALAALFAATNAKDIAVAPGAGVAEAQRRQADRGALPKKPSAGAGERRRPPRVATLVAASAAAMIAILGVVFFVQTADGTVRIEVLNNDLSVAVDGRQITITNGSGAVSLAPGRDHTLAVKLGETALPLGGTIQLNTQNYNGKYALSVNLQGASLVADRFTFVKGADTVVRVSLEKVPAAAGTNRPAPIASRVPAPDDDLGRMAYSASLAQADREFDEARFPALKSRLEALRPSAAQADVRGWEWYYLYSQAGRLRHVSNDYIYRLAYSPNGKYLAMLGSYGILKVLETGSWREIENLPRANQLGGVMNAALAWSPDSARLAVGGTVKIVDLDSSTEQRELLAGTNAAEWVAWSPAGTRFAAACRDGVLRIWQTKDWRLEHQLSGNSGALSCGAWDSTGEHLLAGALGPEGNGPGAAIIWSASGQEEQRLAVTTRYVAWQSGGNWLAIPRVGGRAVEIWDARQSTKHTSYDMIRGGAFHPAWSRDGKQLAAGSVGGDCFLWNTSEDFKTAAIYRWTVGWNYAIDFSPDGREIAVGSGSDGARLVVFDASAPPETRVIQTLDAKPTEPTGLCFDPTGRYLSSVDSRSGFALWDCGETCRKMWQSDSKSARHLTFNDQQQRIAFADGDSMVRFADMASGATSRVTTVGSKIVSLKWRPRQSVVLAACADGAILEVPATHPSPFREVNRLPQECKEAEFTHDATKLAVVTSSGKVLLSEGTTFEATRSLNSSLIDVRRVRWSRDGDQLAVLAANGAIEIWDTTIAPALVQSLKATEAMATDVAWDNTGDRLAITLSRLPDARYIEPGVAIWDRHTGQKLLSLVCGHEDTVKVAWSRDGRRLAAFDKVGRIRVWDAGPAYAREQGVAVTTSSTTP